MHKNTLAVGANIKQYEDIPDRVNALKDSYKGEDCYIVTAGPSLKNYSEEYLKEKLDGKLVIGIKQALNMLKGVADFHVLNFTNFEPYNYSDSPETLVVWEIFEQYHPQMIFQNNLKVDLMLPVTGNHERDIVQRINASQAGQNSFDDWTLDKTLYRMYGPGLMYEVAIHLAVHLGVKSITTIGWDIGDVSKFNGNNLYEDVWQDHYYEGDSNIKYAKTPMNFHEVNTVVNSVEPLSKWLKSRGIDFTLISDRNPASKEVRRSSLEEVDSSTSRVIVDVGAAELKKLNSNDTYYLFEPEEKAYNKLSELFLGKPNIKLYKQGLYNAPGVLPLYITKKRECTSLLEPDSVLLESLKGDSDYWANTAYKRFEVEQVSEVEVVRLDSLISEQDVDVIDILKLDTQGSEYEILEGCGDLLYKTRKIICEVEHIPLYKSQKLFNDILEFLQEKGFAFAYWEREVYWGNRLVFGDAVFYNTREI